ncbi:hypothetical protein [Thermococcus camini]|uniref:Uncharacterized protein n=1 Tax=Thermococcus camini TaxID=2016373 RepID=A0A7G2D778_9EURY|nr:hypothetical protein [Thermococcus camini]CAD5243874.1 conserved protein of unknown function [Thermococcus camini]
MEVGAIIKKFNTHENLFEKLGILLVVVFFLMIAAGFTDSNQAGRIMTLILFILVFLASFIGYTVSKSLDE